MTFKWMCHLLKLVSLDFKIDLYFIGISYWTYFMLMLFLACQDAWISIDGDWCYYYYVMMLCFVCLIQ